MNPNFTAVFAEARWERNRKQLQAGEISQLNVWSNSPEWTFDTEVWMATKDSKRLIEHASSSTIETTSAVLGQHFKSWQKLP